MRNIVVPIDFGDFSKRIINFSVEYAQNKDIKLYFLHVLPLDVSYVVGDMGMQYVHGIQGNMIEVDTKRLEELTNFIKEKNIPYETEVIQGIASDTILEKAKEVDAELILIGSHGHGALYEALVGSVAHDVLKITDIPVLIVPDKYRTK
ncbi:universal stress protein [Flavobacteriaceae bacterium UJ101]|nr:universal stress protein [Flavobacteriaceae bacterium UJ101]